MLSLLTAESAHLSAQFNLPSTRQRWQQQEQFTETDKQKHSSENHGHTLSRWWAAPARDSPFT
jgi:hypothetical protein